MLDNSEVKELLEQQAEKYAQQEDDLKQKREFCLSLAKDYSGEENTINEIIEAIDFLKVKRWRKLKK